MTSGYSPNDAAQPRPYFSVILPIYNIEAYLDECIASVLAQEYRDYELILVDDGATDGSPQICDSYAARFEHIRVIHKPNGGLSSARNAGLEAARGTYIWWVDGDDWIEPGALACLYEASREEKPDMLKFPFYRVGDRKKPVPGNVEPGLYAGAEDMKSLQDRGFYEPGKFSLSAWCHVYRRDFLEKNGFSFVSERDIGSEDYLYNLCALSVADCVRVVPEFLYNYRLREGSLTQRYRKNLPAQYTLLYRKLRSSFGERNLLDQFEGRICNFYVWHLIHGTCFANEYRVTANHSRKDGRMNVRKFLGCKDLHDAIDRCDRSRFTWKQQFQLLAMKMKVEPLFYWLFSVKPRLKKGKNHAN